MKEVRLVGITKIKNLSAMTEDIVVRPFKISLIENVEYDVALSNRLHFLRLR